MALLACASCKKDKDRHPLCGDNDQIEMKIVEYGTHVPIEGAEVYLIVTDDMGNNPSIVEDFETDHSGVVSWPCDMHVESICAQKPESYYGSCGQGYSLGMTWVADGVYELFPHAWVKVTAIDEEPTNPELIVLALPPTTGGSNLVAIYNEENYLFEAYGNFNDELYYKVVDPITDSILFSTTLNIYSCAFDTTEYVISY